MDYIKILIISNSDISVKNIVDSFSELPFMYSHQMSASFTDTYAKILNFSPNIIILDSNSLEPFNFNILQSLGALNVPITLISDNMMDAVNSYSSGFVVDFLLKPFTTDRALLAISRSIKHNSFLRRIGNEKNSFFFKSGRLYKKFVSDEIIFIEAYGSYIKIHTETGKFVVNESISKTEEKLDPYGFIRVHKSFIVSLEKIISVGSGQLEVSLCEIPIGSSYRERFESIIGILK